MSSLKQRVVVVGASSLLGREIAEELSNGPLAAATVVLLDSDTEPGKIEDIAGEAAVLQAVEPASFEGADVVVFATAADAGKYWEDVLRWGAAAVDATGTVQGLMVLSPRLGQGAQLSLETTTVAAALPVVTMLAGVLAPMRAGGTLREAFATVLQPVSENGSAALDELHQQTISLLSFQSVPTEQHDVQVAFNLLRRLGEDAKLEVASTARVVERQWKAIAPDVELPALEWVQAPVFHGYGISLFVTTAGQVTEDNLRDLLRGDLFEFVEADEVPASNVAVAGQSRIQLEATTGPVLRLWMVADNLKLLAQTAVGCAVELLRMRPADVVQ